jgi:tetratricopeptide (TPR) repeat protein
MKPGFHPVPPGSYYPFKQRGSTVTKMNRKVISIIVMALLASSATGLGIIPAQVVEPRSQAAETLLSVLENTHGRVSAIFDSVSAEGGQAPLEAQEQLQEAIRLQEEAQTHFAAGEYEQCIEKATQALNAYGKATAKLHVGEEDNEEPEDEKTEANLGLFTAVEKAREYLEKLRSIASDLESQGVDVTEAVGLLDQAEAALDSAEGELNLGNFVEAEGLLEEARSLMGQATGELRSLSQPKRKEKAERFINQTTIRFRQLEEKMLQILSKYNVSEEDTQALTTEFQAMKAALENMDVDKEGLGNVVDRLKGLVKESREIGRDREDVEKETLDRLYDLDKLEARLNRYRERIRELERLGNSTEELTGLLQEAESLITEATNKLGEGDKEAAERLTNEAESLLDTLGNEIDNAEDETHREMRRSADDDDEEEEPEYRSEPRQDDEEGSNEEEHVGEEGNGRRGSG